jgi:guanylate kinase
MMFFRNVGFGECNKMSFMRQSSAGSGLQLTEKNTNDAPPRGILIVLSGPSGAGKDTILREVLKKDFKLGLSVSATTRKPRDGEICGKDYLFVSEKEFLDMAEGGLLLEYARYCGNYYGTLLSEVDKLMKLGKDIILEIEVDGGRQVKKKFPDVVGIFIVPPSMSVLKARILSRGLDNPDSLKDRLDKAKKEIAFRCYYDYVVVNDDLGKCVDKVMQIINFERMRTGRADYKVNEVFENE